ncbi:hypothetical protein KP79_PYT18021 [Mizuhopecten yessoensis]|uniref:ShKT domain-containing protein n=1 Tax=Mizuhopecten yessoensis TaxID=6573 RepID=A0A210R1T1_MIZYE|nr:hypothetical protein KP79_PYT18021 [Mizuhopecten yessoensis]
MNLFFLVTVCVAILACDFTLGGVVRKNKDKKDECRDKHMGWETCKDREALYEDPATFCQHYFRECCKTCREYEAASESLVERVLEDLLKIESHE